MSGGPEAMRRVIVVLAIAGFASTFGFRMIDPLVPDIARNLGVSVATAASLATSYALTYSVAQPFFGPLGDAYGKILLIRIGSCAMALAFLATAFAPDFLSLSVARGLTGVAAGGIIPLIFATLADRVPLAQRQVVIGRFLFAMLAAQLCGTAGAGMMASFIGWRGVFLVAAAIAFAAFLAVSLFLESGRQPGAEPFSLGGMVSRYRRIFADRRAQAVFGLVAIEGVLLMGAQPYVAAILQERAPVGAFEAGLVIAGIGIGGLLYSLSVGWLVSHISQRSFFFVGTAMAATALACFGIAAPWYVDAGFFVLLGFGFMMGHNTLQVLATELAPEARGSAISLFAFSFFLGQAIGPLVFGGLYHALGAAIALASYAAAILAFGIGAATLLFGRPRTD